MDACGGNAALKAAETLRRAHRPSQEHSATAHAAFAQQAAQLAFQEAQLQQQHQRLQRQQHHAHRQRQYASQARQQHSSSANSSSARSGQTRAPQRPWSTSTHQPQDTSIATDQRYWGTGSVRTQPEHAPASFMSPMHRHHHLYRTRDFMARHMGRSDHHHDHSSPSSSSTQVLDHPHAWAESMLAPDTTDAQETTRTAENDDEALRSAARDIHARASVDSDLQQSQFMALMEQLAAGDVSVVDGELQRNTAATAPKQQTQQQQQQQTPQQQHQQPQQQQQQQARYPHQVDVDVDAQAVDAMMEEFRRAFQSPDPTATATPNTGATATTTATTTTTTTTATTSTTAASSTAPAAARDAPAYAFQATLQAEDHQRTADDFVQMGQHELAAGRLVAAILNFERACQLDASHVEAWQLLGTSRAENEQDEMAIAALRTCLQLDPTRRPALLAIATSYANEMQLEAAYDALESVVRGDSRFTGMTVQEHHVPHDDSTTLGRQRQSSVSSLGSDSSVSAMLEQRHDAVVDLYLSAIEACGDVVDADLQIGLGILQHMKGNFSRAIDCFELALSVRPDDFQLWNKLGACLANGNRSAEAVDVYRRALELRPGFIRAMYNMGVSCINLKAYEQAAEYFLTALDHQSSDANGNTSTTMSDTIWQSLRMTLMMMEKYELALLTEHRSVAMFKSFFKF
ncbi:hypothetical protein PTSG_01008 [Salpingoeca rosetta]|uniref:Peroxin-5 n=1 Tax=Salpingoeca rosetta (strain ATCC 50818 / BSB-021) TaxID=946362 RepID=F2TY47_SALR5|nr:uncharacterized protein PTSG_01008 [Salpingoeca rosetta]EGD76306.1 hypothetical protein PTSG_01008 [Salpingoeca rosetta]|eukprot:XP_004998481.1 hypothetical protein PTSG_01008 [Salpingoeca rosetta]